MDEMKKEEIKTDLLNEDLKKLYSTLSYALGCGGEVLLEVKHGRTKKIIEESKIHLSSPIFNSYNKMMEGQLKEKEDRIEILEKGLRERDDRIKSLENGLKEKEDRIKGLENGLKEKDAQIEKERAEHNDIGDSYVEYILSIEAKLKELEQITKEARKQGFKGHGKSIELPPRDIREVIRLWALGVSIKDIEKNTGASRGQINRVINGNYTSSASKEKAIKAINKLLQVNQNKEFIDKLKGLKSKYE